MMQVFAWSDRECSELGQGGGDAILPSPVSKYANR